MESTFARGKSAPSKKIVALGIFVVAIVAVTLILKADANEINGSTLVLSGERELVSELDSDNDGLKDWQESLYNTNPKIADTDGDGIRDKEDVEKEEKEKREEELRFLEESMTEVQTSVDWGDLSYSEQTSQLLLAQYLSHKQDGEPLGDDEIASIIGSLPTYSAPERTFVPFSADDIQVIDTNTSNDLRAYGNALGLILKKPEGEEVPNELLVFQNFSADEDGDTFVEELAGVVAQYTYVLDSMKILAVPSTLANIHLLILNRMGVVRNDLETMEELREDPFVALAGIQAYGDDLSDMTAAFDELRSIFEERGIEFGDSEPGSILNE